MFRQKAPVLLLMYGTHLGISLRLKRRYFNSLKQKSEWDRSHSNPQHFGNSLQQFLWQTIGDIQLRWRYMNSLGSAWRRAIGDGQSAEWKDNVGWVSSYQYWPPFCRWQMSVAEAIKIHCEQKKDQISHFVYKFVAIGYSLALLTGHGIRIIPPGNKTTCSFFSWLKPLSLLRTAEDVVLCPFTRKKVVMSSQGWHLRLEENRESSKKRLI